MPKYMSYAIIKLNGVKIGRAEKIYFPKSRKTCKIILCHGRTTIEEDD